MSNIFQTIRDKKHQYDNGKSFSEKIHYDPDYYIDDICNIMSVQQLPKKMQNNDMFRHKVAGKELKTKISQDIYDITKTKDVDLKEYANLCPADKVLCWGALFDTLLYLFKTNAFRSADKQSVAVISQEYKQIPKRYISGIKKQDNQFTVQNSAIKYHLVFKNEQTEKYFMSFIAEAEKLISLIYQEDYDENVGGLLLISYPNGHKEKPKRNKFEQNFVSDEQIRAIRLLQGVFRSVASLFWSVNCKNNAYEMLNEYRSYISKQNQYSKTH